MKDSKPEVEKYDMRKYWNKRAEGGVNTYQKVCGYSAPPQYNEIMNKTQKLCLNALLNQIPDINGKRVLEVGCGVGRWTPFMTDRGAKYVGVDISSKMIEIAKRNMPEGDFHVIDGEKLDFVDNYFDLVFSITVLHHIPYGAKEKIIQEMCRITKKNGYILIVEDICFKKPQQTFFMFPLSPSEWITLFKRQECEFTKIVKHKFRGYLLALTKKSTKATNNTFFISVWTRIIERVATALLPWKFFAGCAIVFRKVANF